jgi:hypothetical protein
MNAATNGDEEGLRVGGMWRYVMVADGAPLNIVTFAEAGGRTTLTILVQCANRELRDLILGSGMEVGMQEQLDILEELASSLA